MRHLSSGLDCAMAGAAIVAAPAAASPVTLIKSRRFTDFSLGCVRCQPSSFCWVRLGPRMNDPVPDYHPRLWAENAQNSTGTARERAAADTEAKTPERKLRGFLSRSGWPYGRQPSNLFRTIKLSKPSSATCHH